MMGDTNAAVYRRAKTGLSQGENGFIAGRKRLVARARNRLSGFTASLTLMVGRRKCAVSGRCGACHHYASAIALVVGRVLATRWHRRENRKAPDARPKRNMLYRVNR